MVTQTKSGVTRYLEGQLRSAVRGHKGLSQLYDRFIWPLRSRHELDIFLLRRLNGSLAIDVGANVGTYSQELARLFKTVLAFEPLPQMYEHLVETLPENVVLRRSALGSFPHDATISIPVENGRSLFGQSTLRSDPSWEGTETSRVHVEKLDDVFAGEPFASSSLSFVKIDVEGYEYDALLGMAATLRRLRPVVLVEIEARHDAEYARSFSFLRGLQYRSFYTPDGRSLKACDASIVLRSQTPENYKNDVSPVLRKFRPGDRRSYINNFWFLHETDLNSNARMRGLIATQG